MSPCSSGAPKNRGNNHQRTNVPSKKGLKGGSNRQVRRRVCPLFAHERCAVASYMVTVFSPRDNDDDTTAARFIARLLKLLKGFIAKDKHFRYRAAVSIYSPRWFAHLSEIEYAPSCDPAAYVSIPHSPPTPLTKPVPTAKSDARPSSTCPSQKIPTCHSRSFVRHRHRHGSSYLFGRARKKWHDPRRLRHVSSPPTCTQHRPKGAHHPKWGTVSPRPALPQTRCLGRYRQGVDQG